MKKSLIIVAAIIITTIQVYSQTSKLDSLTTLLKTAKNDTSKYNAYIGFGEFFQFSNTDTAVFFHSQALKIAENIIGANGEIRKGEAIRLIGWDNFLMGNYDKASELYEKAISIAKNVISNPKKKIQYEAKKLLANTIISAGVIYSVQGNYEKASVNYLKAIEIASEINEKLVLSRAYGNIAIIYDQQGDFATALDYYFKALKLNEETNNKRSEAANLGNIGLVYHYQENYEKALEYYFKGLKINKEIGSKTGVGNNLGNIGVIYYQLNDVEKASIYLNDALKINEEIGNKNAQGDNLGNIGGIFALKDNYKLALDYYLKALQVHEEIGNQSGKALHFFKIGDLYLKQKKYMKALKFFKDSESINRELNNVAGLVGSCKSLSDIYSTLGKHKDALFYFKEHVKYSDILNSEKNKKATFQKELQFMYEKKAATDSISNAKEKEIKDAEIAKQKAEITAKRNQQYLLFGGIGIVLLFSGFIYNRFRVTQKQKLIIEEKERETMLQKELIEIKQIETEKQKYIIEEKHKEITDSINYAERIQRSFLATREILDKNLIDYFVFFKPKDVVSGDFYWASKLNNENFAFCCADSTGHGVPGAIMSILNISSLEKSIETEVSPDKILDKTRRIIIDRLKNDGSIDGGKDGMDASLLILNKNKTILTFASANNPVIIIRNKEIIEFKGDKIPVGKHDKDQTPFTLHSVQLIKNDVIYTLTDGFIDQFGGENDKKYMIKRLKELFLRIVDLPMNEQKQELNKEFNNWKGTNDQVDDVCIIGVKV